jgi:hypothetical protein
LSETQIGERKTTVAVPDDAVRWWRHHQSRGWDAKEEELPKKKNGSMAEGR